MGGEGVNGHIGIIIKKVKYVRVSEGGVEFTIPAHPGYYPSSALDDTKVLAKKEPQHKPNILEHYLCAGVVQVMKYFIFKAIEIEWLANIEDEVVRFTNKTPIKMLDHLDKIGGALDYVDTNEVNNNRDAP